MSEIRLYLDEDSMHRTLVDLLRLRGIDVRTAREDGMLRRSDPEQLEWAATHQRTLCTNNVAHFNHPHAEVLSRGGSHAGIVLIHQQRYTMSQQLRGLVHLLANRSAEDMHNTLEYLGSWIARAR